MSSKNVSSQKLSGKSALVTGGSRSIGAAIAKRLASEGANVAITYAASAGKAEEVVREITNLGVRGLAIKADAADVEATRAAVTQTVTTFGGIDILVNNAGIAVMAPIDQFKVEDFSRTLAINVTAVFVATQEASRHMKSGGRIIHIGSCNGERMPFQGGSVYALSKAAICGFTRGLARDLGPRGITVNNVEPGPVNTDMNPDQGPFADMLRTIVALGRYGHVDEIANFVAFLASPEAGYITGANLLIDGGVNA